MAVFCKLVRTEAVRLILLAHSNRHLRIVREVKEGTQFKVSVISDDTLTLLVRSGRPAFVQVGLIRAADLTDPVLWLDDIRLIRKTSLVNFFVSFQTHTALRSR